METAGNAPAATILQGSSAPLCCPLLGAWGTYRACSSRFSVGCNDLICHPGELKANEARASRQEASCDPPLGRCALHHPYVPKDWRMCRTTNPKQQGFESCRTCATKSRRLGEAACEEREGHAYRNILCVGRAVRSAGSDFSPCSRLDFVPVRRWFQRCPSQDARRLDQRHLPSR